MEELPERRTDDDTRDRLSAIQSGYEHVVRHSVSVMAVLFVVLLGLGVWSVALSGRINSQANRAKQLALAVQRQRRVSLLGSCQQTNTRYYNAVGELNALRERVEAHLPPLTTKAQVEQSYRDDVTLIDALVPVTKDCAAFVQRLAPRSH